MVIFPFVANKTLHYRRIVLYKDNYRQAAIVGMINL